MFYIIFVNAYPVGIIYDKYNKQQPKIGQYDNKYLELIAVIKFDDLSQFGEEKLKQNNKIHHKIQREILIKSIDKIHTL